MAGFGPFSEPPARCGQHVERRRHKAWGTWCISVGEPRKCGVFSAGTDFALVVPAGGWHGPGPSDRARRRQLGSAGHCSYSRTFLHPFWLPEDLRTPKLSPGLPGRVPHPGGAVDTEASGMGTALFQSHGIPVGPARPLTGRQIRELRRGLQI